MKTALIVIDVQNYFVNDFTRDVPSRISDYLRKANMQGVYFTKFINTEDSNWVKSLGWKKMFDSPDTDLAEPLSEFSTNENTFEKTSYSIFGAKKLTERIRSERITKLKLCGIDTDACVLASAYDAFDQGYEVEVIEEFTGSHYGLDMHKAAMNILKKNLLSKREE